MKKILAVLICLVLIACAIFVYMKRDKFFSSEPQVDETETTFSTETNESDIPLSDAYSSVIEDFRTLIEYRFSDDFGTDSEYTAYEAAYGILEKYKPNKSELDIDYHLHCMLVELPYYSAESASDYGYVIEDVNNDGADELFWTNARKDFIYAIFTVKDEKPVMLDAFWSRYRCNVKDGEFITKGSGGAEVSEHSVRTIDFSKPGYLNTVAVFGTVNGEFYSKTDGIETAITEAEYSSLSEKYPFNFNQTGLKGDLLLLEGDTDSPPSDNTENSFSRKEILSETEEEKLSIAYPYMIGSDQALNEFVNGEIKRTIDNYKARWLYGEMYDELGFLTLEADYEITCCNEYTLSIVFKGFANRGNAAPPSNTIFTLNLDLPNKQRLKLSDVTDMDTALIDNVCDRINNISTPEIKNYLHTLDMNNILQNCDHDGLEVSAYSYMKDDSLVLVLFTIHALGDYAEIPIE